MRKLPGAANAVVATGHNTDRLRRWILAESDIGTVRILRPVDLAGDVSTSVARAWGQADPYHRRASAEERKRCGSSTWTVGLRPPEAAYAVTS